MFLDESVGRLEKIRDGLVMGWFVFNVVYEFIKNRSLLSKLSHSYLSPESPYYLPTTLSSPSTHYPPSPIPLLLT